MPRTERPRFGRSGAVLAVAGCLAACGNSGLEERPDLFDTGEESGPVGIESIDPNWSLPDEETTVTVRGHGFSGDVTVDFGRATVAATRLDDENVVVVAPAAGVETTVDVVVHSDLGEATLEDGFTWAMEEPVDTGEPGDTGSGEPSGLGKTGGLVQFQLVQIACPDCLGYTSSLQVTATAGFHAPTAKSWVDWLPAKGTCELDPAANPAASAFLDAGSSMWLEYGPDDHPTVSVELNERDGIFTADGLTADDFVRTAGYRVEVEGGSDVPGFTVVEAFYTPDSISALSPEEMLYTTSGTAFAAEIRKSRADFTWSSNGGVDGFAVVIDAYSRAGDFLGELFCYDGDSGTMRVPSAYLAAWPSGSLLVIGMYRYGVTTFQRPDNASTVEAVITFGVLGTGILAN